MRAASAVRDRLSSDNWRLLSRLLGDIDDVPVGSLAETLEFLDRVIIDLVAVGGLETAHMTRDDGWRFLSLGRHLERLLYIATTVGEVAASGRGGDPLLLEWLLDLSDSLITYRARYMRHPEELAVAHLLTAEPGNPRAASFQLARLAKHARDLPGGGLPDHAAALTRAAAAWERADEGQRQLFAERDLARAAPGRERSARAGAVERNYSALLQPRLRIADFDTLTADFRLRTTDDGWRG